MHQSIILFFIVGMLPVCSRAQNPLIYHIPSVTVASCDITATTAIVRLKVYLPSDGYVRRFIREPLTDVSIEVYLQDSVQRAESIKNPSSLQAIIRQSFSIARRECFALLDSLKNRFAPESDTVHSFQVVFQRLEPNTQYYLVARSRFATYFPGAIDPQVFSSFRTSAIGFRSQTLEITSVPTLRVAQLLFTEGGTLHWQAPTGKQPGMYQVDVAQDKQFTRFVQGYNNRTVNSASLRVYGLAPNTRYYYRVRALVGGQATLYSTIGTIQTLSIKRFNADEQSLAEHIKSLPRMANSEYDRRLPYMDGLPTYYDEGVCNKAGSYYSYTTGASLSWQQTDSLLSGLMDAGLPLDSAWAQDNSTCDGKNNGASELLIKLRINDERIRSFGFSKRYNDWASTCECRNYRLYYNFGMPVAVKEERETIHNGLTLSPNPALNELQCRYSLRKSSTVHLRLLDVLGRVMYEQNLGYKVSGEYEERIETNALSEGVYLLQMITGNEIQVGKVVIVR